MIPGLAELRGYRRAWLAGDLLAGVTVAAYLVPQVMAYATIAGLPPVTGLWAAVPALIAYVLFGSSKSLSMGPEATWRLERTFDPALAGPLVDCGSSARVSCRSCGNCCMPSR